MSNKWDYINEQILLHFHDSQEKIFTLADFSIKSFAVLSVQHIFMNMHNCNAFKLLQVFVNLKKPQGAY